MRSKEAARRIRDAQRVPVYTTCHMCLGEIYVGQSYYDLPEGPLCEDCIQRYARQYFLSYLRTAMPDTCRSLTQEE